MTPPKVRPPIPAIALSECEAAAALGMGVTSFREYVLPDVKVIRRGKLRLYPVAELERWATENAERVLQKAGHAA